MRTTVTFQLYFHQDFDGICSGAVFLAYARLQGLLTHAGVELTPVEYDLKTRWGRTSLPKPCAVVDFLYHPDAEWWFDHHPTTFVRTDWELSFKADPQHVWNTTYKSCPRLIVDSVTEAPVQKELTDQFGEYLHWSDIIDSAEYESPEQVVEAVEPALQINLSLAVDRSPEHLRFLVRAFEENPIRKVASYDEVQSRFRKAMDWQKQAISYIERVAEVRDGVAFCDLTQTRGLFHRYAAYYLWPNIKFLVAVYRDGKGFKLTVGANPWRPFSGPDLSLLCERYGGGGHPEIGGILVSTKKRALQVGREIAQILKGKTEYVQQLSFRHQVIRQSH